MFVQGLAKQDLTSAQIKFKKLVLFIPNNWELMNISNMDLQVTNLLESFEATLSSVPTDT